MSEWPQRNCVPRPPALTPDAIEAGLRDVPGWAMADGAIERTFSFRNYHETVSFINAVAWIAHTQDHHPDIAFGYKTARVRYRTHSAGGISENDLICAARINALVAS